jgi:DNA-binding response OmpR family regulator
MNAATVPRQRVLVVDDEENLTELVSAALRYDGFDTLSRDNGISALDAATRCAPDLIVLDLMMSGLDGLQVVAQLRAAGSPVPVIMLTARDTAVDRANGLRAGADDYLVKPFSIIELLDRVHRLLPRPARTG